MSATTSPKSLASGKSERSRVSTGLCSGGSSGVSGQRTAHRKRVAGPRPGRKGCLTRCMRGSAAAGVPKLTIVAWRSLPQSEARPP